MSGLEKTRVVVYALVDPHDSCVRYVGKSTNANKRLDTHIAEARRDTKTRKRAWIKQLLKQGLKPQLVELEVAAEAEADDAERFWIASVRATGAMLLNMTDGGEVSPMLQPEAAAKVAAANRGSKRPDSGPKISAALKGRK